MAAHDRPQPFETWERPCGRAPDLRCSAPGGVVEGRPPAAAALASEDVVEIQRTTAV
jgi:hypothetical protein